MKKLLVSILVLGIVAIAAGQITLEVCETDGETTFDCNDDIMVGSRLTIIVSSDSNDYWSGGLFIAGQDRAFGTLAGRDLDPNTRDWTGSRYENAGDFAKVTAWKDSSIWGFDLYTFYPVDGNSEDNSTVPGNWFIIDYEADKVGDYNVGFYDYSISWDDPNYFLSFSHSPTRDLNGDGKVNFIDFAIFASKWNATDCGDPNWCDGADLDRDSDVDYNDLGLFADYWLWLDSQTIMMAQGDGTDSGSQQLIFDGFVAPNFTHSEEPNNGTYAYVLTVGQPSSLEASAGETEYDYHTISDAIAAMRQNNLDENHLGQIRVHTGTYIECIGGSTYGDDSLWLPKHCDLTGMGDYIDDVVIEHPAGTATNAFTIIGAGDNVISHLKVYSNRGARNGIYLFDNCTLTNCIVDTIHLSVMGRTNLVVSDCTIKSMFGSCIKSLDTFSISKCTLNPRGHSHHVEVPKGISAYGSGTIEDVTIMSTIASSYKYEGAGLIGIQVNTSYDETVTISNTKINLQLTTKYHLNETAALRVCGIMSGRQWFEPNLNYLGRTVVKDCDIEVVGIESSSDPDGDGAGIMVDGVCVRGGGTIELKGNTIIKTSRTPAGHAEDGYEYSFNNENGVLEVESDTVIYDDSMTNGSISDARQ